MKTITMTPALLNAINTETDSNLLPLLGNEIKDVVRGYFLIFNEEGQKIDRSYEFPEYASVIQTKVEIRMFVDGRVLVTRYAYFESEDGSNKNDEYFKVYKNLKEFIDERLNWISEGNGFMTFKLRKEKIQHKFRSNSQGVCPVCDSDNLDYDSTDIDGMVVNYSYICRDCETVGIESYDLVFVSHFVDGELVVDHIDNNIKEEDN